MTPKIYPCRACIDKVDSEAGPLAPNAPEAEQADRYRLWQAQHLIHLFEDFHGRPAASMEELNEWERAADQIRRQARGQ